jgi:HK97 family phage portal protein
MFGIKLRFTRDEERTLPKSTVPQSILAAYPGPGVTPDNALTIADAYACVRALSDAAASLPLIAYRRRQDGSRERYSGLLPDLLDRPAPATSQANLIGQAVAHLNTWGNAYIGKWRDENGRIVQLACLPPDRVIVELRAGTPVYTYTNYQGAQSQHGTDEIVHVKALSTDGLVGLSPVRQARVALALSANLTEHGNRFFENDARPGGILQVPATMGDDATEDLQARWDSRHRGLETAHNVAVLTGDVNWIPVSMPLKDAQFLENRQLSATEVARIFRVPPWVIGAATGDELTYSNVTNQAEYFVKFSLIPHLTVIEQAITNDPDLSPRSVFVEFLLDALLRGDAATRAQVYEKALNPVTGWMTRAEVRKLENLDPTEDEAPVVVTPPPAAAAPTNGGTTSE